MNHRLGRTAFALLAGLLVAYLSYQWITNPEGRAERALQVNVVAAARTVLNAAIGAGPLEIVDPVAPNRRVGKAYIYREGENWAVSGHYRRGEGDRWHAYLMLLGPDDAVLSLKVQDTDPQLIERAVTNQQLEVRP
ncbi:MAG: hypothetical protein IIB75_04655 [Proteobacteria bacterium]|nr:hypothetical protein [Pseudomonadota bacterium]